MASFLSLIAEHRAWLKKLDFIESAYSAEVQRIFSDYSAALFRAVGVNTHPGTEAAIRSRTELAALLRELDRAYQEALVAADRSYRVVFGRVSGSTVNVTQTAYQGVSKEAVRAAAEFAATQAYRLQYNAGLARWHASFSEAALPLRNSMQRVVSDGFTSGMSQRQMAQRIFHLPEFQHANLPKLKLTPERAFGGRLGTNDALKFRAARIVRAEIGDLSNRLHETVAQEAGLELFVNYNPLDSRTTDICLEASRQRAMTLEEWDASEYGRPPRGAHYGNCRSHLLGVPNSMREQTGEPEGVSIVDREVNGERRPVIQEQAA